jgi:putative copper resistance protein D
LPILSASIVIGYLFHASLLLPEIDGRFEVGKSFRRLAFLAAWIWFISSALLILTSLREILGTSFDSQALRSYLTQISLGRVQFFQLLLALLTLLAIRRIERNGWATIALIISLIGLCAPFLESHSGDAGMHGLAIGSIIIHMVGLSIWIGVIAGFLMLSRDVFMRVNQRWSVISPWIVIAVVASGLINGWTRMNFRDAFNGEYARILFIKVALVTLVLALAWYLRRAMKSVNIKNSLIAFELGLLLITAFVGSWLSRTEPPLRGEVLSPDDLRALALTGVKFPQEPTLWRLAISYEADGLILGALIFITALYIAGVVRLARRGVKWPIGRTISFALGISAIDFATSGGLGLYAIFSFSHHMMAHMVLGMIAPIGIVLGAPITLALRALPSGRDDQERGVRGLLVQALASKPVVIFSHPIVALAIFDGSLFALYFTSIFDSLMGSHIGHVAMSLHFLLAGILFFHVIIGIDPRPRKYPYIFRIVILFAAMSIHAFFSISLLSSTELIGSDYYQNLATGWVPDLLADQRIGASIGWAMGEIPILISLIATFIQWIRSDERDARRIYRASNRAKALGEKDELDHYNDYLARLAKRDEELG